MAAAQAGACALLCHRTRLHVKSQRLIRCEKALGSARLCDERATPTLDDVTHTRAHSLWCSALLSTRACARLATWWAEFTPEECEKGGHSRARRCSSSLWPPSRRAARRLGRLWRNLLTSAPGTRVRAGPAAQLALGVLTTLRFALPGARRRESGQEGASQCAKVGGLHGARRKHLDASRHRAVLHSPARVTPAPPRRVWATRAWARRTT